MSYEEDYLMEQNRVLKARVALLEQVAVEAEMLNRCVKCTTAFAGSLTVCPHCGHQVGQPVGGSSAAGDDLAGQVIFGDQGSVRPGANESKEAWQRYAESRGVEGWESMTKDQLIEATR